MTLTAERLREVLRYDPETGIFTWRIYMSSKAPPGKQAGCPGGKKRKGYIRISIDKRLYPAHRLVFLYVTGRFPERHVDHDDRDPQNNRWKNLREATQSQNMANAPLQRNNTSGIRGVRWNEEHQRWQARICINKKEKHLGYFETLALAKEFRDLAAALAFGEFASYDDIRKAA